MCWRFSNRDINTSVFLLDDVVDMTKQMKPQQLVEFLFKK